MSGGLCILKGKILLSESLFTITCSVDGKAEQVNIQNSLTEITKSAG